MTRAVPTTQFRGRHDPQVPLAAAEAATARFGWPLHVVEDAGDAPALERPAAASMVTVDRGPWHAGAGSWWAPRSAPASARTFSLVVPAAAASVRSAGRGFSGLGFSGLGDRADGVAAAGYRGLSGRTRRSARPGLPGAAGAQILGQ